MPNAHTGKFLGATALGTVAVKLDKGPVWTQLCPFSGSDLWRHRPGEKPRRPLVPWFSSLLFYRQACGFSTKLREMGNDHAGELSMQSRSHHNRGSCLLTGMNLLRFGRVSGPLNIGSRVRFVWELYRQEDRRPCPAV